MRHVDSTRAANDCQQNSNKNTKKPGLGYKFDPIPSFMADLLRDGRILPLDEHVLKVLLRFRPREVPSCWTTKAVVAEALNVCPRTVQRSFQRLTAAGVIAQRRVMNSDSHDPKNRTGWRIVFLWLEETPKSPRASTSESPVSPTLETVVSPKDAGDSASSDGMNTDRNSSLSGRDESACARLEEQGKAIEAAMLCFPKTDLAETMLADAPRIEKKLGGRWDAVRAAVFMASGRKNPPTTLLGWILVTARDYVTNGISAEATAIEKRRKTAPVVCQVPKIEPAELSQDAEIASLEEIIRGTLPESCKGPARRRLAALLGAR